MRRKTFLPLLFGMALAAAPVSAQQVSLTIQDGLVNLDAQGASVRQILDAWSRIGGTKIVNGERVGGGPVTLKLVNTPERQALDIVLRAAAGYMAVPRAASGTAGESIFGSIMVLPTSSAPQNAARTPPPAAPSNPFLRGNRQGDEEEPTQAENEPEQVQPPVFSFPNQGQGPENAQANPFMQQGGGPNQPAPFGQPSTAAVTGGMPFGQQPQPAQAAPFGQPSQPNPANPFAPTPPPAAPFGQPAQPIQTPFGTVQPTQQPFGQQQAPAVNPFAAALSAAQQQQQQQQQSQQPQPFQNVTPPAPGTFTIIGSPTPGVVAQPQQPNQPLFPPRPPGQR